MNLNCKKKDPPLASTLHMGRCHFAQSNNVATPFPAMTNPSWAKHNQFTKQTLVTKKKNKSNQCLPNSRSGRCRLKPHHGPQLCLHVSWTCAATHRTNVRKQLPPSHFLLLTHMQSPTCSLPPTGCLTLHGVVLHLGRGLIKMSL